MYPITSLGPVYTLTFPLFVAVAFGCCYSYLIHSKRYQNVFIADIKKSLLFSAPLSVLGAKLLFMLTQLAMGKRTLLELLHGSVFLGGLLGVFVALVLYSKRTKIPFLNYTDVYLSILPLAQSIGRFGCYCNGCCYGIPYEGRISVRFPVEGEMMSVFPTWFVESFFCFLLFIFFYSRKKTQYRGYYTGVYLCYYSIMRFFLEFYRGDTIRGVWHGISTSQFICVTLCTVGCFLIHYAYTEKNRSFLMKENN